LDLLKRSYLSLEQDSAPWQTYGENLEEKLEDLHDKVHQLPSASGQTYLHSEGLRGRPRRGEKQEFKIFISQAIWQRPTEPGSAGPAQITMHDAVADADRAGNRPFR
jgi:hypothetical protein